MRLSDDQINTLKQGLPKGAVKDRTQGGKRLSYLEGQYVIDTLNRVFGFGKWEHDIKELRLVRCEPTKTRSGREAWEVAYVSLVTLTVHDGSGGSCSHTDVGGDTTILPACGDAHENSVKGAVTDALKRCARCFGEQFGLSLYGDLSDVDHVGDVEPPSHPPAVKQITGRPQWSSAAEAQQWAVEAGHYKTAEDAQAAYKHSCADLMHKGGQPTSDALYDAWYVWATNARAWTKASAHLHAKAKEMGQDGERARGWIRKAYAKAAGREVGSTREIPLAEYRDLVSRCIAKMGKAS